MNVLITAAGRRTSLVRTFVDEAHRRGGRVFGADVDALAPALDFADEAIRIRHTDQAGYVDDLIAAVKRYDIRLLVPTIDGELPILAAAADRFLDIGCRAAVSSSRFVDVTLDKYETGVVFGGAGIHVPWSWLPPVESAIALPDRVFAKPRRGSASQDQYHVERDRLSGILPLVDDPIIQEVLEGPEITIDALIDFEGRPIHYVPRYRIRTLGGESVQGVTLQHDEHTEAWIERVLRVSARLGGMGPLTIQAFHSGSELILSEINPRFGGGYPLAFAAGGKYAAWLMDMVAGIPVEPRLRDYEPGVFMTRYNVEHFTKATRW